MEPTEGSPRHGNPAPGEPPAMAPRKRRRRWLIVAFVLVLVSLGTWWNWPRGDARFVGKWQMTVPPPTRGGVMTFHANGTAHYVRTGVASVSYPWFVTANRLRMGDESKGSVLWVKQTIYPWVSRHVLGRHYSVGVATDYEILSIDREKIRLRAPYGEILMTRIPE